MTGICGWIQVPAGTNYKETVVSEMSSRLSGRGGEAFEVADSHCLAVRAATPRVGVTSDGNVLAIVEGVPFWQSDRLKRIAANDSNSKALAVGYAEMGRSVLGQLRGSFSLCVVDVARRSALLAIDRMGVRPLCYSYDPGHGLVFGSTADAVIASGVVSDNLSSQSIYDYFFFHVIPSPSSIYSAVSKLEPAQYLELSEQTIKTGFYWLPELAIDNETDTGELQVQMKECLRESVARTCPNDKTATFLSGGLDSSTVSGLANEISGPSLSAFSIGFDQEQYNELEYARIAATHFGLDLNEYFVTPDDVVDSIDTIVNCDEPFGNSSIVPAYLCALRASEAGMGKMLAGDGGDELFAGNERYAKQQIFEYYWRVPASLRRLVVEKLIFSWPMNLTLPTRKIRRYVEQARIPMPDRLFTYTYLQNVDAATVFDPAFLESVDVRHPIDTARSWYDRSGNVDIVDRMLFFDWKLTLADNDLRKVNMACDLAGVDVAYPMLDDHLVEFSLRVPARDKITPYNLRAFFKKSFSEFLPTEIINKQKHGFGLPFGEWLLTSSRLQDRVDASIERLKGRGIFKSEFLDDLRYRHKAEHAAYYGNLIWIVFFLDEWLARHGR